MHIHHKGLYVPSGIKIGSNSVIQMKKLLYLWNTMQIKDNQ